jgi:hypothetical protein
MMRWQASRSSQNNLDGGGLSPSNIRKTILGAVSRICAHLGWSRLKTVHIMLLQGEGVHRKLASQSGKIRGWVGECSSLLLVASTGVMEFLGSLVKCALPNLTPWLGVQKLCLGDTGVSLYESNLLSLSNDRTILLNRRSNRLEGEQFIHSTS